jgi:F-type H+-transporting ATPase subunit b
MLPNLTVLWVIFFVLLLAVILDRLLFKPLMRVVEQREAAIRSARELAEKSAGAVREAMAAFDEQTAAARAEIYRQMEEMKRSAVSRREELLAETRREAEAALAAARAQLAAETEDARRRLAADAEALGHGAAERILGRQPS